MRNKTLTLQSNMSWQANVNGVYIQVLSNDSRPNKPKYK